MSKYRVLVTDYAWPNVDQERQQLGEIEAEFLIREFMRLIGEVCWTKRANLHGCKF